MLLSGLAWPGPGPPATRDSASDRRRVTPGPAEANLKSGPGAGPSRSRWPYRHVDCHQAWQCRGALRLAVAAAAMHCHRPPNLS